MTISELAKKTNRMVLAHIIANPERAAKTVVALDELWTYQDSVWVIVMGIVRILPIDQATKIVAEIVSMRPELAMQIAMRIVEELPDKAAEIIAAIKVVAPTAFELED